MSDAKGSKATPLYPVDHARASTVSSRSYTTPMTGRIIVVAVDSNPHSKFAFEWYINNIHQCDDFVVLCHIPEMSDLPAFTFKEGLRIPANEWAKTMTEQIQKVRNLERQYHDDLTYLKIKFKLAGVANDSIGEGIIKVVEEEKADMVIMGSRGITAVRRMLVGCVSDHVVRNSRVPVLICPATASNPRIVTRTKTIT